MIYFGQTHTEGNKPTRRYDMAWTIMRFPTKGLRIHTEQHPELSPSRELYAKCQEWKDEGIWSPELFEERYVPEFIHELARNMIAVGALNYLYQNRNKKDIILLCGCADEQMCHRRVVRSLLIGAHFDLSMERARKHLEIEETGIVQTDQDMLAGQCQDGPTRYWDLYRRYREHARSGRGQARTA